MGDPYGLMMKSGITNGTRATDEGKMALEMTNECVTRISI